MSDLLVEIGTEELPARFIEEAKDGFVSLLRETFDSQRIKFSEISSYATPRRLAVIVKDLSQKREETVTIKYGPPVRIAFDEHGNPKKPAFGFANSMGVPLENLIKVEKDGVLVLACERKEGGEKVEDVLPNFLEELIPKIPFPKRMRWGYEKVEFARPIRWILALYEEKPIKLRIADVESGSVSFGHRFLRPDPIEIKKPSEYLSKLEEAFVIVDQKKRRDIIIEGIKRFERDLKASAIYDESLIQEILYLTEYPYALLGSFDATYLELPEPVLINVMRSHQRYIPLSSESGKLMPNFIFFANTIPKDESIIIKGNEKVLKARLDDARFYFEEDRKLDLFRLYDRLSSLTYHEKIGSMKEKAERIKGIALHLAESLGYKDLEKVEVASRLLKTDLLTHMVGEFPELQGRMGRIYAELRSIDTEISQAIEEHYFPHGSEAALPSTKLGTIMALSDKIDSLVSFFSVGISPTGNMDPYGLRRCAIGLLRILLELEIHINLQETIKKAYDLGSTIRTRNPLNEVLQDLEEFLKARFKYLLIDLGYEQDLVESVLPWVRIDPYDSYLRLKALRKMRENFDFQRLIVGFKRVYNITKKIEDSEPVLPDLFEKEEEGRLYSKYLDTKETYYELLGKRKYDQALDLLTSFKDPIDRFFDNVFVMVDEEMVRRNRLSVLSKIKSMFRDFCLFEAIRSE